MQNREGIVRGLTEYIGMNEIYFTQLGRRIKKMCTNIIDIYKNNYSVTDESIILVID